MPLNEDTILTKYLAFWLTVLGAALGSFLDCAVSRWAAGEQMFAGRSRCFSCGHILSVFDLIPVFSWLFHRGKCGYCGEKIPADCLWAELAGGSIFLLLTLTIPPPALFQWLIWAGLLLALGLADWARQIIPNRLLLALAINRIVWFFVLKEENNEQIFEPIFRSRNGYTKDNKGCH